MFDREKVIKGLECCADRMSCSEKCPYVEFGYSCYDCVSKLARDALALLRKQEPVKPELRMTKHGFRQWLVCGYCYEDMHSGYNYCPRCGRAVKWK